MADTRRDATNTWFQRTNHLRLKREELNMRVIFDAAVTRAAGLGKTIANTARGVAQWSPVDLFPGPNSGQGLVLDFSDISTLYTSQTFATNISAIGDPVGGVIDKSQGLVLGAEKLTNGGFDTDLTGWTAAAGFSVSGGKLIGATSGDKIYQAAGITAGEVYSFTITGVVGEWGVRLGQDAANDYTITADGTYFITPGTLYSTTDFRLRVNIAGSELASISVKKLSGNHLKQATSTARPIWTRHPKAGVRNLLDASEDFSAAGWSIDSCTKVDEGGRFRIVATSAGGTANWGTRRVAAQALQDATPHILFFDVKAGTQRYVLIRSDGTPFSGTNTAFDLLDGSVIGAPQHTTYGSVDLGDGVYRLWVGKTTISTGDGGAAIYGTNASGSWASGPLDGSYFYLYGAQLEEGSSATTYQTRVSKYDVTESGVDDCYGLTFDGVDDYLVTAANLDLSGTDEAQVTIGELTTALDLTGAWLFDNYVGVGTASFSIKSPHTTDGVTSDVSFTSSGTGTRRAAVANTVFGTPNVVTGISDISQPLAELRIDGAFANNITIDQGTGTHASSPFTIGARNSDKGLHWTGTIYGVTLTDYILDAEQLAELETWTAARTPEVALA